jgi:hypothetical protein
MIILVAVCGRANSRITLLYQPYYHQSLVIEAADASSSVPGLITIAGNNFPKVLLVRAVFTVLGTVQSFKTSRFSRCFGSMEL